VWRKGVSVEEGRACQLQEALAVRNLEWFVLTITAAVLSVHIMLYLLRVKPADELNRSFTLSHIWSFPPNTKSNTWRNYVKDT